MAIENLLGNIVAGINENLSAVKMSPVAVFYNKLPWVGFSFWNFQKR